MIFQINIVDQDRNPIHNANAILLDYVGNPTTIGNSSAPDGKLIIYSLGMNDLTRIRISHVGYKTVVDTVKNLNYKTIVLNEETTSLPGVVVTAPRPTTGNNETVPVDNTKNNNTGKFPWLWILGLVGIGVAAKAASKDKTVTAKI